MKCFERYGKGSIHGKARNFFCWQTGAGVNLAACAVGTGVSFSVVKATAASSKSLT